MPTRIIMPKLGMAMSEGVVAKWLKQDGDPVEKEEPIVVVMSKKITYKVAAPSAGVLRILAREKETLRVGALLAVITEPGETVPSIKAIEDMAASTASSLQAAGVGQNAAIAAIAPTVATSQPSTKTGFVLATPAARRLAKEQGVDLAQVQGSGADGMVGEADVLRFIEDRQKMATSADILATSSARRLALEHGLDIAEIQGSGIGGRITEQDVQSFIDSRARPSAAPKTEAAASTIPFTGMRQAIAEHMVESLRIMAQLTLHMEVDATELVRLRSQLKTEFDLTYTDLLVKAVAKALKRHPLLNSTLIGNEIHLLEAVHIGVAVALEDGLIVPVIRDADKRTIQEIAQEARRLAQSARDGSLSVDEVAGSTFTITNLGAYGIDGFTPIINSPEAAILGVGRIVERPVIYEGEIAKRSMMVLSLTIDHRIVDGAPAADFLRTLKELLENPCRLLV